MATLGVFSLEGDNVLVIKCIIAVSSIVYNLYNKRLLFYSRLLALDRNSQCHVCFIKVF